MAGQTLDNPPLIAIVGQTATGKSGLALALAERFNGELICADSRTVYRGMDIGTAKPTAMDRQKVPHHCLDIADPTERFTAADFKRHADRALAGVIARGRLPILVGGTGLYVDAVLYDYTFRGPMESTERSALETLSVRELQQRLHDKGIALPNNPQNPRHLVRSLETNGAAPQQRNLRPNSLILGLKLDREDLLPLVTQRVEMMIEAGLEAEVRGLAGRYGFDVPPMQTIGYQEWQGYVNGVQNLQQTKLLIIKNTMAYAKRQATWFKRNNSVQWLDNRDKLAQSVDLTTTFLSK